MRLVRYTDHDRVRPWPNSEMGPDHRFWTIANPKWLSQLCLQTIDTYSSLTRSAPLLTRLLTVRTEWSRK